MEYIFCDVSLLLMAEIVICIMTTYLLLETNTFKNRTPRPIIVLIKKFLTAIACVTERDNFLVRIHFHSY